VAVVLAALTVVAIAAAKPSSQATPAAALSSKAHTCLVMTGSGDPAFTKNFNPFTSTGLPSGSFVKGAFYEGLTVSPEGGKPTLPWLARSWKWSNSNKTLTLNLAKGVKWSDGKPLTSVDVVYSLTAGRQNKVMDLVGFTRPDSNIASVKAKGAYSVVINLKTPDSQFIGATLNLAIVIPRHIWSHVAHPDTFTNPNPVGSGPYDKIVRFTPQDYVFGKNTHYWQKGKPLIPCLEYVQASSNDSALALIQSGQVDWTHRTSRRRTRRRTRRTSTRSTRRPPTRCRSCSTTPSTPTASRRSARRCRWRSTATPSRSSVSTDTPRRPMLSA
jgi:peptide/nickel transport system substrate-binding protein